MINITEMPADNERKGGNNREERNFCRRNDNQTANKPNEISLPKLTENYIQLLQVKK